ncbi:cupin domain-containing protein [Erythrobacter sp.]|jgi:predicted cupin superfamily sugar epimerase|uniref:cupin domain-containing protein n=1 Tax=Erythrobacter sp. TaxID=1042 RepID=UPI002EB4FBC8|nr:cupin domain-containing protein [Erythrobacter sp.]
MNPNSAAGLIEQLGLARHPEGGWYRETWRGAPGADGRASGTAIQFLLAAGEASHWHRIDADELWLWQGGDPLELRTADGDEKRVSTVVLGPSPASGHELQARVPAGAWQAAQLQSSAVGYCLVSCIVVPGFEFSAFELAPPGWSPNSTPNQDAAA